jgi:lipopolysaccharide transport system ATP-binding protein
MGDVARGGRTVLFVSHNMAAIESLCGRVIWIDDGRVVHDGPPGDVVSRYLRTSFAPAIERGWDPARAPGNESVRLTAARVVREGGAPGDAITVSTPFRLEFEWMNLVEGTHLNLSLHIYNEQGLMVFNATPAQERVWQGRPFPRGRFRDRCHIPANLLNDGVHRVELLVVRDDVNIVFRMDEVLVFDVRDTLEGRGAWYGRWPGAVRPRLAWETELDDALPSDASSD